MFFFNSWCLRIKLKLPCDLKSLGRDVIMHVLFPTTVIVLGPVYLFLARKLCVLMGSKVS